MMVMGVLVLVVMVILLLYMIGMGLIMVMVVIERMSGTWRVRFEERANAERLGILRRRHLRRRWTWRRRLDELGRGRFRCGRRSGALRHVYVRRREPALYVQLGRRGIRRRGTSQRRPYHRGSLVSGGRVSHRGQTALRFAIFVVVAVAATVIHFRFV